MNAVQSTRYLSLIGAVERPPSMSALSDLVTAQIGTIPFENLSKLIHRARDAPPSIPSLDAFLGAVERDNLGGTCYACATHFNALLRRLGYDVRLCGAAMNRPDVHIVNVVHLDDRDLLVDVGYAAPLFSPLPLDAAGPVSVALGAERYVLHTRDADGRNRLDHLRDGEVIHGYTVDPTPREPAHFAPAVEDSFRPESEFLNCLRLVRHRPERSLSLHDLGITVIEGDAVRKIAATNVKELQGLIVDLFGIPASVSGAAITVLGDRWP